MLLEEYIKLNYKPSKEKRKLPNLAVCEVKCDYVADIGDYLENDAEDRHKMFALRESRIDAIDFKNLIDQESFAHLLIKYMNDKGLEAPDVYKACNMTKFSFSHQLNPKHTPSKKSALALCIGLKLNLDEATHFLARAGFAFSRANKRDVIVKYYITEGKYDIDTINKSLYEYDEDTIP